MLERDDSKRFRHGVEVKSARSTGGVKVCLGSSHGGYTAGQDFELLVLAGTKTNHFPGGKPMYTPKARAQTELRNASTDPSRRMRGSSSTRRLSEARRFS